MSGRFRIASVAIVGMSLSCAAVAVGPGGKTCHAVESVTEKYFPAESSTVVWQWLARRLCEIGVNPPSRKSSTASRCASFVARTIRASSRLWLFGLMKGRVLWMRPVSTK